MEARAKGTASTFVPRDLLQPRESFGYDPKPLDPVDTDPRLIRQVQGAQLQHLVMAVLRLELKTARKSIKQLAVEHRISVDRLYRMLRGETMMQISDLAAFGQEFGRVREMVNVYLEKGEITLESMMHLDRRQGR